MVGGGPHVFFAALCPQTERASLLFFQIESYIPIKFIYAPKHPEGPTLFVVNKKITTVQFHQSKAQSCFNQYLCHSHTLDIHEDINR